MFPHRVLKTIFLNDSIKYYNPGSNFTFFPTVGSYNAANNAGLIDNIKNEELKRSLLNLYEHLYARVTYNGAILDERTGQVEWESRRYWDILKESYSFDKQAILESINVAARLDTINTILDLNTFQVVSSKNSSLN